MSGEDATDGGSNAPIDRGALVRILDRVRTTRKVDRAYITFIHDESCLIVEFSLNYYPANVEDAYLNIRWYTNDDFKIHYREVRSDGTRECRWDRHPNSHNTRSHFHPPPDATTPGDDADFPTDWRDVLASILGELDSRIEAFWDSP